MINWHNVTVKLKDLTPWEHNPKSISKAHAKRLLDYWQRVGQFQSIAIGPGGEVYDGHQRLSVLRAAYGDDYEIDARQSDIALTDEQRKELVIAAHVGTTGQFDWDALSGWDASQLQEWGMDGETLASWRADATALTEMLEAAKEQPAEDPGAQIDRADELREKWGVETGQMWQLGEHRIICGDCTDVGVIERLMQGETAGAVVTDPPYGMDLDTNFADIHTGHYTTCSGVHSRVIGDDKMFDRSSVAVSAKEEFWWGADYYLKSLGMGGSWVVWDKTVGKHVGRIGNEFELCYSIKPHKRIVIRHYWVGFNGLENEDTAKREHPTQKPVGVIETLLSEYIGVDAIVIDPFLGSGTTLIACERLGRKCRAVEISPAYVAVAIQRWVDMTGGVPELIQ